MSAGGARQSAVFVPEDEYGVAPRTGVWFAMPPGSYFSSSRSRHVRPMYEAGRKMPSAFSYGKVSGTWTWSFPLDYLFLEPLALAFEDYGWSTPRTSSGVEATGWRIHTFSKSETGTMRSFSLRRKRIHRTVGGSKDEVTQLSGCICTSVRFSQNAGASPVHVVMSGIYADEVMATDGVVIGTLDTVPHENNPVQWTCIYGEGTPWGQIQSWRVQLQNSIGGIYGVENSRVRAVYETQAKFQFHAEVHSHNPDLIQRRSYSGGVDALRSVPVDSGAMPMRTLELRTNDEERPAEGMPVTGMNILITDCVFSQASWDSGESGRLLDILDGARCRDVSVSVCNRYVYLYDRIPSDVYDLVPAECRSHVVKETGQTG